MKNNSIKVVLLGICMSLFPSIGSAQQTDLSEHPGYLDLDSIVTGASDYLTSEVYLQNYILKMIAKLAQNTEPEFSKMLSSIQLIRVLEYQFGQEGADLTRNEAEELIRHMRSQRWDTLVRNRESDSNVNIAIQSDREDHIYALAIVSWSEDSMSVVNVVGDIDLELLARLGKQFDIRELEDFEETDSEQP